MEKSDSIKELASALSKAQGMMGAAQMTATNPFLHNKYADLGEVIKAAKSALAANGLSVAQPISGDGTNVTVTTVLMHASGEWISESMTLPLGDEKGKSSAQVAGSIVTYLRRYSLASMLGMYADEDNDAQPVKRETPKNGAAQYNATPAPVEQKAVTMENEPSHFDGWPNSVITNLASRFELAIPRMTATLKFCTLPKDAPLEALADWMIEYKEQRANDKTPQEAAKIANDMMNN